VSESPNKGFQYLPEGVADPEAGTNQFINDLDAIGSVASVISMAETAPPGSSSDGDTYIVDAGGTGAWAGHDDELARYVAESDAWQFYEPQQVRVVHNRADDGIYVWSDNSPGGWTAVSGGGGGGGEPTVAIPIACSDETTALTAGTAKVTFRMPFAFTLTAVRASLTTAQATNGGGGIFTVDINESGATLLSTKLTIDNTEKTSTTAATPPVISDSSIADDAEITIDIDQIGDGTAKGLKVYLIGHKT
jgi:hypothetical protein